MTFLMNLNDFLYFTPQFTLIPSSQVFYIPKTISSKFSINLRWCKNMEPVLFLLHLQWITSYNFFWKVTLPSITLYFVGASVHHRVSSKPTNACEHITPNSIPCFLITIMRSFFGNSELKIDAVTKCCTSDESYSRAVCTSDFLVKNKWRNISTWT